MCNAHNHSSGCDCGWGPPYPTVTVTVRELYELSNTSSQIAKLDLSFPIHNTNNFDLISEKGKGKILTTATSVLQQLADAYFGKAVVKIAPVDIRKGSIELTILLCVVLPTGLTYVAFKTQKDVCERVEKFGAYIYFKSLKLFREVKRKYAAEEQRSLRTLESLIEEK